jgi:hypothetical protein
MFMSADNIETKMRGDNHGPKENEPLDGQARGGSDTGDVRDVSSIPSHQSTNPSPVQETLVGNPMWQAVLLA